MNPSRAHITSEKSTYEDPPAFSGINHLHFAGRYLQARVTTSKTPEAHFYRTAGDMDKVHGSERERDGMADSEGGDDANDGQQADADSGCSAPTQSSNAQRHRQQYSRCA